MNGCEKVWPIPPIHNDRTRAISVARRRLHRFRMPWIRGLNHSGFDGGSVPRNMGSWRDETVPDGKTIEIPARASREGSAATASLGYADFTVTLNLCRANEILNEASVSLPVRSDRG